MSVHVDFIGSSDPFFPVSKLPEPVSERAVSMRKKMGPERWQREVVKARERLCIVRRVKRLHAHGYGSWTACLKRVAPGVHRSTYLNWRRLVGIVEGPAWERLLDARIPQPCQPIALEIRSAAESLRRADPQIRYEMARECLIEQFGSAGMVSDASLGRIWRKAGLANIEAGDAGRFERVCDCPGGAVLAILGAAAAESGVPEALANAALQAGKAFAESQEAGKPGDPYTGRDENGHFTAAYNQSVRQGLEAGQADSRWDSDQVKRERRELRSLSVLSLSPETLAQRLLVMGIPGVQSAGL